MKTRGIVASGASVSECSNGNVIVLVRWTVKNVYTKGQGFCFVVLLVQVETRRLNLT